MLKYGNSTDRVTDNLTVWFRDHKMINLRESITCIKNSLEFIVTILVENP